jgi:hypothetical protein
VQRPTRAREVMGSALDRAVRERVAGLLGEARSTLEAAAQRDATLARAALAEAQGEVEAMLQQETADPRRLRVRVLRDSISAFSKGTAAQMEEMLVSRQQEEGAFLQRLVGDLTAELQEVAGGMRDELAEKQRRASEASARRLEVARRSASQEQLRSRAEGHAEMAERHRDVQREMSVLRERAHAMQDRAEAAEGAIKRGVGATKNALESSQRENELLRRQLAAMEQGMQRATARRAAIERQLALRQEEFWRRKPVGREAVPTRSIEALRQETATLRYVVPPSARTRSIHPHRAGWSLMYLCVYNYYRAVHLLTLCLPARPPARPPAWHAAERASLVHLHTPIRPSRRSGRVSRGGRPLDVNRNAWRPRWPRRGPPGSRLQRTQGHALRRRRRLSKSPRPSAPDGTKRPLPRRRRQRRRQ